MQTISLDIYGHFSEHLGRCIYGGFWVGKDSEIPNIHGYNKAVVQAFKDKEQAKIEIALRRFLDANNGSALCTNFQDLWGMKQLPGLAIQRLLADCYGFGAEGDWNRMCCY